MKIILVSLNSKFIHSNLAIRYLSKFVSNIEDVGIYEFTINQNPDFIASEIYKLLPDVVGFSTYIWNLKETLKVCEILKTVKPELKILLGGPEVSYDGEEIMNDIPYIDYIIYGEGEESFKEFIDGIRDNRSLRDIKGLIYRDGSSVIKNEERQLINDLNTVPFPYENIGNEFENKIIYYESSRGCPFNCQYCLSSTLRGVRIFDIERVKRDLTTLIEGKVRQVKFVDRTFNANKEYAMEILKFLKEKNPENINFHFEITAHLIDDEFLDLLKDVKSGLFQFEIGVQSTNDNTIDAIGRTTDFSELSKVVKSIKRNNNIHQHLDLIAGLPYENYDSFKDSFNDVYNLKPEKLQLGFLKLLKGSGLRLAKEKYGYKYIDEPPYEVLESNYISYEELLKLKEIEDLVEKYYNEGYFEHTLDYLITKHYSSPFEFYEDLSKFWDSRKYNQVSHSRNGLYEILAEFIYYKNFEDTLYITQILKFDSKLNNKNSTLKFEYEKDNIIYKNKSNLHELLRNEEILTKYLYDYKEMPTKKLINKVAIDVFQFNILDAIRNNFEVKEENEDVYILFDYKDDALIRGKAFDITEIVREMI
ncbi:MAG: B12-binding domain-containing radical SAM protein [Tissierellaceae bacterium]|nr:B12-binding domain-containing radical SAM protein [Tissierellaceae bacterium]